MAESSLEEAVQSPYVVLASYQGHEPVSSRSNEDIYLSGFKASYKIASVLKTSPSSTIVNALELKPGEKFDVQYLFHDLTPCIADKYFRFSESLMPTKGSKWFLFLKTRYEKQDWQTYRGSEGRLQATEANSKIVKGLLAAANKAKD